MAGRPRMLMCYLCGREYGSASLPIHIPQCQKKWEAAESKKPAKERRPLPQPPKALVDKVVGGKGGGMSTAEIDAFNNQMYKEFDEKTMIPCPYCGRTFSDTAFKHHQRACTADSPAKPAGTGLTNKSLTNKMATMDPRIAGSDHGLTAAGAGGGIGGSGGASVRSSMSSSPSSRVEGSGSGGGVRGGLMAQSMDPSALRKSPLKSALKGGGSESKTPPAAATPPATRPQRLPSSASGAGSGGVSPTATSGSGGVGGGTIVVSREDLVRLAQAAGAWELKQELLINSNPALAQEILNAGEEMNNDLKTIAARLNLKPDVIARAFRDESYKTWKVT